MNNRSRLVALLSSGLLAATAFAQTADPTLSGATLVPPTIVVGLISQLRTDFANAGFDPIPANSLKVSICGADTYYRTDGLTPPGGYGTNFTWTHLASDCWEGINNVVIAPFSGGMISLNYTGQLVAPSPQTTTIVIAPVANLAAFRYDNTSNNQLSATLAVLSSLQLTKSFGNASIADGGVTTLSFTLTASNTAPASSISFVDTLPAGLRIASPANVGGTCANSTTATAAPAGGSAITISGVNVPAGPSACTVTVQVTNVAGQNNASCTDNPAAFTNGPSNISGLSSVAANGVQPSCLVVTPAVAPTVSMILTKSAGTATVVHGANGTIHDAGDTIAYTFSVNNTGNVAIANVTVVDAKLPALSCVLPTTTVLPGASAMLMCSNNVYTMTGADVTAGRVVNSATGSAVPASCTPAVVPCPSTQIPASAVTTPLDTPIAESAQPVPTMSTLALLLMGLLMMGSAGLVARSKR